MVVRWVSQSLRTRPEGLNNNLELQKPSEAQVLPNPLKLTLSRLVFFVQQQHLLDTVQIAVISEIPFGEFNVPFSHLFSNR